MKCKKHPKYQAKRYPYSECPRCLEIWEIKTRPPADLATYEGDSMEEYPSPPADARAVAEAHSFGGNDIGGRARG